MGISQASDANSCSHSYSHQSLQSIKSSYVSRITHQEFFDPSLPLTAWPCQYRVVSISAFSFEYKSYQVTCPAPFLQGLSLADIQSHSCNYGNFMATFHPHTQLSPQGVSIIHGVKPLQMSCDSLAKGYQGQRSLAWYQSLFTAIYFLKEILSIYCLCSILMITIIKLWLYIKFYKWILQTYCWL